VKLIGGYRLNSSEKIAWASGETQGMMTLPLYSNGGGAR
jgi:hypothetical protein